MPREILVFDALIPTLLLILIASAVLYALLDQLLRDVDWDRYVWHSALFRFSLFVILFSSIGLWWYS
jgi:hypothetical protein